jgi:hypothetical protein
VIYGLVFNFCAFLAIAVVTSGTLALILTPLVALGAVVTPALQGMMSRAGARPMRRASCKACCPPRQRSA